MKKKILLFTLLTTSLLMTGCDPTTSSSSSSSPSESIQEVHVDSIKITNADVTMKVGEVLTLNVNVNFSIFMTVCHSFLLFQFHYYQYFHIN